MPKSKLNKKGGAAFTFLDDKEWLDMPNVKKINKLIKISNKGARVPPSSISPEGIKNLIANGDIFLQGKNLIGNVHGNNSNRKKLKSILSQGESDLIIMDAAKYKRKMEEQIKNISEILSKNLDVNTYSSFIDNPSIESTQFRFENIDHHGDIPKSPKSLNIFSQVAMKVAAKTGNSNVKKAITQYKDDIEYSINSALCWKNVDLTLHSIGTLEDICRIAALSLPYYKTKSNNVKTVFSGADDFIRRVYGPYLTKPGDLDVFLNTVKYNGLDLSLGNTLVYSNILKKNELPGSIGSNVKLNTNTDLYNMINEALQKANTGVSTNEEILQSNVAQEFLVLLIWNIFMQTSSTLSSFSSSFRQFQETNYNNIYEDICNNIDENIFMFGNLVQNAINHHFGIKNSDKTPTYGIDKGDSTNKGERSNIGKMFRVIGGSKSITNKGNLSIERYPIVFTTSGAGLTMDIHSINETTSRLMKIIFDAPSKDFIEKKIIYMGGFVQQKYIGKISMKITHEYFDRLLKNKRENVGYIDKVVEKMRKGLHLRDIYQMRDKFNQLYNNIGSATTKNSKDVQAKSAINDLSAQYMKYRNNEIDALLSLETIEDYIRKNKNNNTSKLSNLRNEYFIKLGHYQMKSLLYKNFALGLYDELNKFNNVKYPRIYYNKIQDAFDKVDKQLIDGLLEKVNKNTYEKVKNKFTERSSRRNVDIFSNSTSTKNNSSISTSNRGNNRNINLTVRDKKDIQKTSFWNNLKNKLDGKTIYIPFVHVNMVGMRSHGLIDLINAAITGVMNVARTRWFFNNSPDKAQHIIYGSAIPTEKIASIISARGSILVTNKESEVKDTRLWRAINVNVFDNLSTVAIREKVWDIISTQAGYNSSTPYIWSDTSETKVKVYRLCKKLYSNNITKCNIITGRNIVAKEIAKMNEVYYS